MGNRRREFTPEYKDEAVKLVVNTGRPVAVVARELGVVEQTLGNWVKAYRASWCVRCSRTRDASHGSGARRGSLQHPN